MSSHCASLRPADQTQNARWLTGGQLFPVGHASQQEVGGTWVLAPTGPEPHRTRRTKVYHRHDNPHNSPSPNQRHRERARARVESEETKEDEVSPGLNAAAPSPGRWVSLPQLALCLVHLLPPAGLQGNCTRDGIEMQTEDRQGMFPLLQRQTDNGAGAANTWGDAPGETHLGRPALANKLERVLSDLRRRGNSRSFLQLGPEGSAGPPVIKPPNENHLSRSRHNPLLIHPLEAACWAPRLTSSIGTTASAADVGA
ncbi:unnamed protein product [Lota lota]